jgi:glycosyltransferase involved in cell wall biosynthesis
MTEQYTRKKILMLIPNLGFGGAEKSFSKLSCLLAQHHDVYVAVFNRSSYTAETYQHGGTFIDLEVETGSNPLKKLSAFVQRVRRIRALKKQYRIDVTISFLEGADYVNVLAGGKDKKILSIRGSKKYDRNISGASGWLRKRILMPVLYNKANVIVSVNRGIAAELRDDFGIKPPVQFREIFNYYPIDNMRNLADSKLPEEMDVLFKFPVLISHGRLSHEKGFQYLLEVFAQVKQASPEARLVLVGDGPYYQELTDRCSALQLSFAKGSWQGDVPDVFFAGFQANPLAWLSKATVFALPSFTEGFPNALAEAMISGVAVIAADCPWGPRDILQGKDYGDRLYPLQEIERTACGLLAPMLDKPGATETWAAAINALLQDPLRREAYRRRAQERMGDFSEEKISSAWLNLIEKV